MLKNYFKEAVVLESKKLAKQLIDDKAVVDDLAKIAGDKYTGLFARLYKTNDESKVRNTISWLRRNKKAILKYIDTNKINLQAKTTFSEFHPKFLEWNKRIPLLSGSERKKGLAGLVEGKHYVTLFAGESAEARVVLSYDASTVLASKKVCGIEGKWCVAMENSADHWDDYVFDTKGILVYFNFASATNRNKKIAVIFNDESEGFDISLFNANDKYISKPTLKGLLERNDAEMDLDEIISYMKRNFKRLRNKMNLDYKEGNLDIEVRKGERSVKGVKDNLNYNEKGELDGWQTYYPRDIYKFRKMEGNPSHKLLYKDGILKRKIKYATPGFTAYFSSESKATTEYYDGATNEENAIPKKEISYDGDAIRMVVKYYKNGERESRVDYLGDGTIGYEGRYYENGDIKSNVTYYDGGKKERETYYDKDGKLEKHIDTFGPDKLFVSVIRQDDGSYEHKKWFENEQLQIHAQLKEGSTFENYPLKKNVNGFYKRWNKSGELVEDKIYKNGKLVKGKPKGKK